MAAGTSTQDPLHDALKEVEDIEKLMLHSPILNSTVAGQVRQKAHYVATVIKAKLKLLR